MSGDRTDTEDMEATTATAEITQYDAHEFCAGMWIETTTTIAGLTITENTYLTGYGTTPAKAREELAHILRTR